MSLRLHKITAMIPSMSADEFADLKDDIARNGIRQPLLTWQGQVIDGRSRYLAWKDLEAQGASLELPTQEWDGRGSLTELVLSLNVQRRHLSVAQKVACAVEARDWMIREQKLRANKGRKVVTPKPGRPPDGGDPDAEGDGPDDPDAGKRTRDVAAAVFGVSGRSVQRAIAVRDQDPEAFAQMKRGEVSVHQAERAVRRQQKRDVLDQIARELEGGDETSESPWEVTAGDVLIDARELHEGCARLVFADPPYNQGVDYGRGRDADLMSFAEYEQFCVAFMEEAWRILTPDGSFWVLISEDWADHYGLWLRAAGFTRRRWVVWDEAFGQAASDNFSKDCRHLFYCVKDRNKYIFNRDDFLVPSARQEVYGDKRAAAEGRIMSNLWHVPRLNDASPERLPDAPTQLPVALLRPIVAGCTQPGDLVVDLFCGSGSMGEACLRVRPGARRFRGFERELAVAKVARSRLAKVQLETGQGGPLDAGES